MKLFLDMRIEELEAFEKERDAVSSFIDMCSVISSVDVDLQEMKEKLEKDLASCRMLDICHKRSSSEEPIVKFFDLSTKNKRMIQLLKLVHPSLLFRDIWQKCIQKAAGFCKDDPGSSGKLTVDKVQELLWTPSYRRWRGMWEIILSGEISLKEVDERFGRLRDNPKSLDIEVGTVLACFSGYDDIETSLRHRLVQIRQVQRLKECEGAAAAILDFQEAMALEGDFQVLDDFCDQMDDEFRRRALGTICDDVLEIGGALEHLPQPMIECLKTVSNCKEYIFWLRKEVKGREEVKTLVDLAMMSAGESDIETDRVSCLHTTALGFAPFIFDLEKCAGLSELIDICDRVWEEIKENESLILKLKDISSHLEWLKGVKDAHAMSSLKLAQAINDRGVYCIGQLDSLASTQAYDKKSIDSVISLSLLPTKETGEARDFSLEKLEELQSKLALISGKNSQGQEDVEKFSQLLQGVVQLGQAYVDLCEIGDVSYLDWREEYKCRSKMGKSVIDDIQSKRNEFERSLSICKEHINSLRMKYHELNYFTTQQLLFLRKELAGLKRGATMDSLNLQVYALLQKVLPGLHQSSLRDALFDAGILKPHLDQDTCSDDGVSWNAREPMSLSSQERDDHGTADQQIADKYKKLLNHVENLNYSEPERLAVAALIADLESTDVELVLWCVKNNANSDLIDKLYDEALDDQRFRGIVNQAAGSDLESSQSSQDSEPSHKSLTEDSDDDELDVSTFEEITLDETRGGTYLSLDEIGVFLSRLASSGEREERDVWRKFPSFLKKGKPNLILARKEYIFAAVLGLYMEEGAQCLPNSDEVLICTSETTSEEVELLWRRALANDGDKLYCLVNGDLLDYDISQKAVDCLHTLMQDYPDSEGLALVVLCSSENEERAHIVTSLEQYKVEGIPRYPRPDELRRYLERQFKAPHQTPGLYREKYVIWTAAAEVGRAENLNVRVVTSDHPGVGKSLVVQRLAVQVTNLPNNQRIVETMEGQGEEPPPLCVTIPFHDKHARVADVVGFFLPHALPSEIPLSRIFHLDSSSTVTPELETLLFNLLILGELTDDRGRVWRRNPYDLYILEITDPAPKGHMKTTKICKFYKLLPSFRCFLPEESFVFLKRKGEVQRNSSPLFDEEELQSEAVQRVWQYLQLFNEDPRLIQEFDFDAKSKRDDSPGECLETLIRNCGVRNPSWSELRYFVNFLNHQLRDCENSAYCDNALTKDTLEGFRTFVVAFMIIMSKDFSMRSLKEEESVLNEQPAAGANEDRDIAPFQLRRRWEKSPHPYIFFNPDHVTMTFLGFRVDQEGNLLDPRTGQIIQERLMSRHLRTGLHVQMVDLNNDIESYSKAQKIQLLCSVMGIECGYDPDDSYELTGDNVKKILAIHMRFRCNIPVVIMGETGCGKTRLIRYLCGLQTEGEVNELKNMLLMKIHGGTTYKDVERNVLHAEAMALQNEQRNKNVDTVLFFDEANTTDALGMIKEIMVDRRCNGRPLSDRLKFIVACNPYRRHTDEMIQKLESAGLGYHVRADKTAERLGQIPLRHLVYRVHALPESMRSLVWDFGQLNPEVEELYTRQIVGRYVQQGRLPGDDGLVIAIATVLAASQQFMRNKKDECSFVSLRDVKRAMEVMVWFYENFRNFSPLIQDEKRKNEVGEDDDDKNESEDESEKEPPIFEEQQTAFVKQRPVLVEERLPFIEPRAFIAEHPAFVEQRPMLPQMARNPLAEMEKIYQHEDPSELLLTEELLNDALQGNVSDDIDRITWSLILALGVCYQARLRDRDEYREAVAKSFQHPCRLPGGAERIAREISRCQQALMTQLKLGPNIACNEALSENVFMMVVCIELRIPLFVVGKPGSSKSLAKTVVADNMQGDNSKSELFKKFKQIQLVSYQCSPQSTPEGILATFRQCSELQESKNTERTSDRFASVVVLDEVGLAEDSPKMPLKTLHPLLEDGDQNDDDIIQTEDSFTRVAFIGLSNWALDPAKMNRGIMLCRNEPDDDELEATARGICGGDQDIMALIEPLISPLVRGYTELYNKQKDLKKLQEGKKDEFFGLRDFYSLLKMVVHIAKEQKRRPNWGELEHAIKRNFSGLLEDDFNPVRIIMRNVGFPPEYFEEEEEHRGDDSLNLIQASLDRKGVLGEGRYLLIMTENFAALPRVKQLLVEKDSEEPYVIFGSGFPKDQLFTQVCRNINRVKICMETGRTVILLNLENLYESLYDALNQYYVTFGGEKYVDLGLGNHRVKCRVHKDFRLIVIAEKDVVYNNFPIPLINRLEKHFLVMSSGLTEPQEQLTRKLNDWVKDFAEVFQPAHENPKRAFKKGDAFIGYHGDTVPAVVLQVCAELHDDGSVLSDEDRESWEENVLRCCQERLLQCATPDSVTRLRCSRLSSQAGNLWTTYFREQEHSSLVSFLEKALNDIKSRATGDTNVALRAQISTHSRLLSDRDIPDISKAVDIPEGRVKFISLQQFQTEQQFCNCIGRDFWARHGGRESLLIVQCDSADQNLGLVACSRHLLIEECREMEKELHPESIDPSHILMIVQLSRVAGGCSEFVGVQGDDWQSIHIDELCPPSEEMPPIEALMGRSVSSIFESALHKTEPNLTVSQVLVSCVQEAASRIEDDETTLGRATKRIELLLKLLSSQTKTGEGRFEMVLAERLCQLLQEKDQRAANGGNEWLQTEALSPTVHETGTFKKALWHRYQSVVAPILAEVIAYVDRDGNLELVASEDTWMFNLWLRVFRDSYLSELSYESFQEGDVPAVRNKVPVLKSGHRSHAFQCRFPFSWLLKERIDELYRDARSIAANSHENVTECLRRMLNNSEVKSIVSEAISEGGEESVVACYLHDFIHMVYKPHDDDELEVVQKAITAAAKEIQNSVQTPGESFALDLSLVHVAHSRIQQRLHCLSLFLQAKPDIVLDLRNRFSWDEDEMTVDAMALQMCLERMEPSAESVEDRSRRQAWCDQVLSAKIPVEETISRSSSGDKARVGEKTELILTQCRCMWQRLSAVRMFIEHVYPSQGEMDPQDLQNILKLWKALGDGTNFSRTESLNIVERFLVSCSEDSIQRLQEDTPEDHETFLHRCNAFFMEIVSVFCFGEDVRFLDPEVFEMLMRFVTGTQSTRETREFSPFPEFGADSSPVVRSFLLQQLINSSDKKAKKHLQRFLYEAQGLSSEVPHILNVSLLAVQCMENSWTSSFSKNANLDLAVNIGLITKLCQDALKILNEAFSSSDELQVDSLEAVAKARYTLGMAAEFLYLSCVSDDEKWRKPETRGALDSLFMKVKALCTSGHSRSPALYLLKQLVKRYGGHSIATISQREELSWIVPAEFQRKEDDGMNQDRFLVYGERYREVRDSLARAILSQNTDELIVSLEDLCEIPGHARDIVVLLALYREVAVPQNQHKCALIKDVVLERGRFLSTSARHVAKDLFKNSQGLGLPFLPIQEIQSEIEKALPEILFHVTTILRCIEFDEMVEPLRRIVLAPNHMMGSFLPTMPEDSFHETSLAISEGGKWYECPAGHPYFIGDCGRPDQTRDCPWCESGVAIGGEKHQLVPTNRLATRRVDRSNTGHILGAPQRTIAERDLSPGNVSLLRVILHSAMLAGAYREPEAVSQLMQPEVQPEDVCGFLWEHLVNDVRNISTSLERSEDEVLLMIHLVLSEIMNRSTMRGLDPNGKWSTKAGRKDWENEFVNVFARPVCTNLEERLQNFYALSVNDRRLGNDPLMREIYEVDTLPPARTTADIHPGHAAFWKYRTRVTVEYVIRQFQDVKSNMAACKVLGKFLAEEHSLRAVCHLPDILALHRILTDRYHRRIDRDKANQLKIRDFLQEFPKGQRENVTKLFRSFSAAWDQVRLQLSSQGRFSPTKEQCSKPVEMNSTVSVLLPANEGAGVCCKGLLFFLVNKHNELVQAYYNAVTSNGNARTADTIPLSEVSGSQLIAYDSEKDLLPVMLANCSYSLEVGKETQLQYNWETLEKQIIDRFIRGRPQVDFEVDNFMFREDARDFAFDSLRSKIPQEPIPGHIRAQILSELKDLRNVRDLLSTLDMAIGFLSTAGGDPEMKINDYFKTVLLLTDGKTNLKSKKAQQFCSLHHILDLWSTLAVARAKLLIKNEQDPFEEVPDIFKTEMPRQIMTHFSAALKKVDIELFLSKVVEVISLWLAQEEEQTGEMGLGEYLLRYSDDYPDAEEIPEEVCVKHVIYAWQLALEVRERDQGRRRSMMS
ncbi:E3 ubiquitin-protein ligase rnf213-alpha-like isoform X3 [Oculina patagonica]